MALHYHVEDKQEFTGGSDEEALLVNASDGEDDEEEEEEEEEEFDLKKRFDEILNDLKSGSCNLTIPSQREAFLARNREVLCDKTNDEQQNLLHVIAYSEDTTLPSLEKLKPLVKILVQLTENLLAQTDGDNKTPLYIVATRAKKRFELLRAMCEAHENIDSVLGIQCFNKETCLHVVIRKKVPHTHILYLINLAGEKTLCVRDIRGNTPLHIAVDYELCFEDQIKVVEALIAKSDKVMDLANAKGLSPYRHHEETRKEAIKKDKKAQETIQRRGLREVGQGGSQGQPEGSTMDGIGVQERHDLRQQYRPPNQMPRQEAPSQPLPLQRVNSIPIAPPGKFGAGSSRAAAGQVDSPKAKPMVGMNIAQASRSIDGKIPSSTARKILKKSKKKTKAAATTTEKAKLSPEIADDIKSFLKLYYLRTRKHDAAVEFLYGPSQEHQIYFDLFGCNPVISQSWIKSGVDYLKFEDVLQYVAVPQVRVESQVVSQRRVSKVPLKPDGQGRTDLVFLFKWLKKERNVKTILKVIVDDLEEPAHSDQAIESALEGMGVEDWDWRKTDLCLDVIHKVAPMARIVHLYWSGNNTTLKGWGEPEGLAQLKKLEKVFLSVRQGLETFDRTDEYVNAFTRRIKEHSPNVVVDSSPPRNSTIEYSVSQAHALQAEQDEQEVRHRWLTTMDEFANFLENMKRNLEPPLQLKESITVALIDDGIDIHNTVLHSRIVGGRSFCHRDTEQNLSQPYYISSGGHGTAMASLICRICPSVELYVLKLNENGIEPGKRQITAESAAKAIFAAVDRGVHIISMSWTIEPTDADVKGIAELETAIEKAANKGILMFCAATDQGAVKDKSYPAASSTKKLFKIGAASATGTAFKWLGDPRAVDFIFPGHRVAMECPGDLPADKYKSLTGSSVATALAAGLAAVILYCMQVGTHSELARQRGVTMDDFHAFKRYDRMRNAFLDITTTEESEKKYIAVWERFKVFGKKIDDKKRQPIELVTELAVLLKGMRS